eukprot:EG_transcript_3057
MRSAQQHVLPIPKGGVLDIGVDENPTKLLEAARANRGSFWTKRGVNETRVERYATYRDHLVQSPVPEFHEQFIVTEVDVESRKLIHPFNQGSPLMLLRGAVQERRRLRFEDTIITMLQNLWKAIPKNEYGKVDKDIYSCMHCKIQHWLLPEVSDIDALQILEADWLQDSKGLPELDEEMFSDAMFAAADIWVPSLNILEYINFFERCMKFVRDKDFRLGYQPKSTKEASPNQVQGVAPLAEKPTGGHTASPRSEDSSPRQSPPQSPIGPNSRNNWLSELEEDTDIERKARGTSRKKDTSNKAKRITNRGRSPEAQEPPERDGTKKADKKKGKPNYAPQRSDAVSVEGKPNKDGASPAVQKALKEVGSEASTPYVHDDGDPGSRQPEPRSKPAISEKGEVKSQSASSPSSTINRSASMHKKQNLGGAEQATAALKRKLPTKEGMRDSPSARLPRRRPIEPPKEDQGESAAQEVRRCELVYRAEAVMPRLAGGKPWTMEDLAHLRATFATKTDQEMEVSSHAANVNTLEPTGSSFKEPFSSKSRPQNPQSEFNSNCDGMSPSRSLPAVECKPPSAHISATENRNINYARLAQIQKEIRRKNGLPDVKAPKAGIAGYVGPPPRPPGIVARQVGKDACPVGGFVSAGQEPESPPPSNNLHRGASAIYEGPSVAEEAKKPTSPASVSPGFYASPLDWLRTSGSIQEPMVRRDQEFSYGVDLRRLPTNAISLLPSSQIRVVISDIDQNLVPACKESHVKVDLEALRHIGLQSYLCGKPLSNEHLLPGPSQVRYLRGRSGILKAISVQPADPVLAEVPA